MDSRGCDGMERVHYGGLSLNTAEYRMAELVLCRVALLSWDVDLKHAVGTQMDLQSCRCRVGRTQSVAWHQEEECRAYIHTAARWQKDLPQDLHKCLERSFRQTLTAAVVDWAHWSTVVTRYSTCILTHEERYRLLVHSKSPLEKNADY